jgi:hypothetical protein
MTSSVRHRIAAATLVLVVLSGCTGVPRSSQPEVIRPVTGPGNGQPAQPSITPAAGDNPRNIVSGFLQASVLSDAGHSAARQFLTAAARRKWQDNSVIVVDDYRISVPEIQRDTGTAEVVGRRIGQIDSHGVFAPVLKNLGLGDAETFAFTLTKTGIDWRIDQLPSGVLVRKSDFESKFHQWPLYFFDAASERVLVPDLRYSPAEGQPLANWLLAQILDGPRPELASSVVDEIPAQIDPSKISIAIDKGIQIEMPGASQIDAVGKQRLAAQLAYTFGSIQFSKLRLTDSGAVVPILGIGSEFDTDNFPSAEGRNGQSQASYYFLRAGALHDGVSVKPVPGLIGAGRYQLSGAAVRVVDSTKTLVAGVSGTRILMGSVQTGLSEVRLPASFVSRPAWRPGSDDVWLGTDRGIFRIGADRAPHAVTLTPFRGGLPTGTVKALRFSPDGVRVAVVFSSADDGSPTVWVGSVVRSGNEVRIDSLEQVTPPSLRVSDVAWSTATSLAMVAGDSPNDRDRGVWTAQSDGSLLTSFGVSELPGPPVSIAASSGQFFLVAAGGAIWLQRGGGWVSADGSGSTSGESPTYAE